MSKRVLVIEDDEIVAGFIETTLTSNGFQVEHLDNGEAASKRLEQHVDEFDAILLDRMLPGMDGMSLLKHIKQIPELQRIPVIMETAMDDKASIQEGMDGGAYYYLTKPLQRELLITLTQAACEEYHNYKEMRAALQSAEKTLTFLENGLFKTKTIEEGRLLTRLLSQNCPQPDKTILGLQELIINAVEHGNLGITYDEKTQLVKNGQIQDEITRRLNLAENMQKFVEIQFNRYADRIEIVIHDQGDGFEWQKYLDFDPDRAFDPHGRGIAMSRNLSLDSLEYQGNGNTVLVTVNL